MFSADNENLLIYEVEASCLHNRACFCYCNFCLCLFVGILLHSNATSFPLYSKSFQSFGGTVLLKFCINYVECDFTLRDFEQSSNFPFVLCFFILLFFPHHDEKTACTSGHECVPMNFIMKNYSSNVESGLIVN